MANKPPGSLMHYIRRMTGTGDGEEGSDAQLLERFVTRRTEAAFEALFRRHGPLVLGVCRRVLGHEQDADDVFQATFLVLARQAGAIRKRQAVGSWLYGVAYRLARRAKAEAARRREQERQAAAMRRTVPAAEPSWQELAPVLDEELHRLPRKYRDPLILCYLQGKTHAEAARQLGRPAGSISRYLARGQELLRARLVRRGVAPSAGLLATVLADKATAAVVPVALACATVRNAWLYSAGPVVGGAIARPVAALAEGWFRTLLLTKVKLTAAVVLAAGLLVTSAGALARRAIQAARPDQSPPGRPQAAAAGTDPRADKAAPAHADRYGDPLPPGALARMGTVRLRHEGFAFAFSPDSRWLASAGHDRLVRLWDVATGKELRHFAGHGEYAYSVAFSPDGKLLASGDIKKVHLWDPATGKEIRTLTGFNDGKDWQNIKGGWSVGILCLAFSPDGKILAAGEGDLRIRLWEVATGKDRGVLEKRAGVVYWLAFLDGGKTLVSSSDVISFWDVVTKKEMSTIPAGNKYTSLPIAVAPDGKTLAYGPIRYVPKARFVGGTLCLWDRATGKERYKREVPRQVGGIAFSPDGKVLAWTQDKTIHLSEAATGKDLRRIHGGQQCIGGLAFSPDGKVLACAARTAIQFWDVATGRQLLPRAGHAAEVTSVAFSPDGKRLVSTSQHDGTARLWDSDAGRQLYEFHGKWDEFHGWAFCPDGKTVVSSPGYNTVRLWDAATGQPIHEFQVQPKPRKFDNEMLALGLSADGKRLAVFCRSGGGDQATIVVWAVASGKELVRRQEPFVRPHKSLGESLRVFSPDGQVIAELAGNAIDVRDVASGELLATLQPDKPAGDEFLSAPLAFTADGRTLVCGSAVRTPGTLKENKIRFWELATGKEVLAIVTPYAGVAAFAPDGSTLASADGHRDYTFEGDTAIRLWDVATGKELLHYQGHGTFVQCLAFDPDGKRLATGLVDSTILVWDLTPGVRRAAARALLPKDLEGYWADLAAGDARKARTAIWALAAAPGQTIDFLKDHLRPAAAPDPAQVRRLIADLDSNQFTVREGASRSLEKLGEAAAPALHRALAGKPSREARRRLNALLAPAWIIRSPLVLREVRAVQVLEQAGSVEARSLLRRLTEGVPQARLTREARAALARLDRRSAGKD